jgi:gamma-glutamyltranspeptidase/glutathione hydrolase
MVATGSPEATTAALRILKAGGNAIDAAAAAHLALMVTDPANTSIGGRAQILIRLKDGRLIAIDGATQAPAAVKPLAGPDDYRRGYAIAPVPGNLAALAEMVKRYGRLRLADALQPAIELAEMGFRVPPRLAANWDRTREALLKDPGAAENFLKPDGSAYQAAEVFRQPRLARMLRQVAESGVDVFYRGPIAEAIARDAERKGGFVRAQDLRDYRALPGTVVRTTYRGYPVVAAGGRAWGNTLVEMLNILDHFPISRREATARETEIIARVMAQSLEDRPQETGTLKPKQNGLALGTISSRRFGAARARLIKQRMLNPTVRPTSPGSAEEHDTTHLSVMDAEGNAVALTTSIGPSFGARVATPELGFLYAHSYEMRSNPAPGKRDLTEMTPTIIFQRGQPMIVIGAAGSERIPTAILQVISNVIDRRYSLEQAVTAPRIFYFNQNLRMQPGFSAKVIEALRARGFTIDNVPADLSQHLGLVHAVCYHSVTREFFGAADPLSDGSAGGPDKTKN